jgi:prominin 1
MAYLLFFLFASFSSGALGQQCRDGLFPPFSSQPVRNYNEWKLNASSLSYVPSGVLPFYQFTEQFVDSIVPEIPYELIKSTVVSSRTPSQDFASNTANSFSRVYATLIGVFALGLLFAVCFPCFGCLVCCLRCCGYCGGDYKWSYTRNIKYSSGRYWLCCLILTAVLLLLLVLLITGVVLAVIANVTLWYAIREAPGSTVNAMEDVKTYLETTKRDVNSVVIEEYDNTAACIIDDIDKVGVTLVEGVYDMLNFTAIQAAASGTVTKVNQARMLINQINDSFTLLDGLKDGMIATLMNLDQEITRCGSPCASLAGDYENRFASNVTNLPDISSQVDSVNNSLYQYDVGSVVTEAQEALNTTLAGVIVQVGNFSDGVKTLLEGTVRQQLNTSFGAFNGGLDTAIATLNGIIASASTVNNFTVDVPGSGPNTVLNIGNDIRLFLGLLLCFLVICVIFLACCGQWCGCIGLCRSGIYPPARDKFAHCGGKCLILSASFICVVWFLLMFSVAIAFLFGALLYVPCSELDYPEYTVLSKTIDDPDFISALLPPGDTTVSEIFASGDVSLRNSLVSCSNNTSLYSAINLDAVLLALGYNLTAIFDSVQQMIDEQEASISQQINAISITPPSIIDASTLSMLMNLQTVDVGSVDVQSLSTVLLSALESLQVGALETNLNNRRMMCGTTPGCDSNVFNPVVNEINTIKQVSGDIMTNLNELLTLYNDSVAVQMEVADAVASLLNIARDLNTTLSSSAQIKTASVAYVTNLFDMGSDYLAYLQRTLRYDVAKCYPAWAAYQTLDTEVCDGMVASFNTFWFSIGWCLLFLVPLFVTTIWLSWFFISFKDEIIRDDDRERMIIMTNSLGRDGRHQQYHEMTDHGHISTYYNKTPDVDSYSEDGDVNASRKTSNAAVRHDRWNQTTVYSNKFSLRVGTPQTLGQRLQD